MATHGGPKAMPAHSFSVSPSDEDELTNHPCTLFVGGAGNIALVTEAGDAVTFTGVLAGSILPVQVRQVKDTNTTATNMMAMW